VVVVKEEIVADGRASRQKSVGGSAATVNRSKSKSSLPKLKIYAHIWCTSSKFVLSVAHYLDLDYEVVYVDLMKSEHLTPEFAEKNPNQ